jgi:3-phenylpropionate/trans-cinnamate dioxygenase ferredoxin subunit
MTGQRVCALDDLKPLDPQKFEIGHHLVCVVRIEDDVYAIGDTCTHAEVSLSEGEIDPDLKMVECWKHGSMFSLVDGHPDSLPAVTPVEVYTASVRDGDVWIEVGS